VIGLVLGLVIGLATTSDTSSGLSTASDATREPNTNAPAVQTELSALRAEVSGLEAANGSLQERADELLRQVGELTAQLEAREPLPSLVGLPRDEVEALADEMGWDLTVQTKESAKPVGTVLSQAPKAGMLMSFGKSFTIVVAKPLPPKMPNLVGQTLQDAQALAEQQGWTVTSEKQSSSEPPGTILSQTPRAGTFMRGSATFSVVIAKKPPPEPVEQAVAPPPPAPANCHSSYAGACLKPDASDYDCAGGSGNGPYYVEGPVSIVGPDVFGLDSNGNGVGCED
jgi:hypothetical protein